MENNNARARRLIIGVAIILAIMVIPAMYLNMKLSTAQGDPAYQALNVYSQSLRGNQAADTKALEVYPTLTKHTEDGKDYYTRAYEDKCWKLDLTENELPQPAAMKECS